ncbi:phage head closure protein [Alcaligenaceae bacterium B3P038]|nr:phage head closure protein [Alcaligenaceae bacterium B3P038]
MGLAAGTLNRRISIEERGPARDALGQPLVDAPWVTVASVWANIAAKSGLETASADTEVAISKYSIRIRYRLNVDSSMRVLHGKAIYQIEAVLHDEAGRMHTDLVCRRLEATDV